MIAKQFAVAVIAFDTSPYFIWLDIFFIHFNKFAKFRQTYFRIK